MRKSACPYLGTRDANHNRTAPISYPTFENHCFTAYNNASLMLADQATYCLSGGHRLCPRYQSMQSARARAPKPPKQFDLDAKQREQVVHFAESVPLESDTLNPEVPLETAFDYDDYDTVHEGSNREMNGSDVSVQTIDEANAQHPNVWRWLGAGVIFVTIFLLGGSIALYIGWQLVQSNMSTAFQGQVATLSRSALTLTPQVVMEQQPQYVVITATSPPSQQLALQPGVNEPGQNIEPQQNGQAQPPQSTFPQAVTATPTAISVMPQNNNGQLLPAVNGQNSAPQNNYGPVIVVTPVFIAPPTPVQQFIPTPRPTPAGLVEPLSLPVFEPPTLTPIPPTETPTPIPLGPPIVSFGADVSALYSGECTDISWTVKNVKEVYYEGRGVDGSGDSEECVKDETEIFALTVVLPNGTTELYTTTVRLILPTATPTPTPSFTPIPVFTATWTPEAPATATATPVYTHGTTLTVNGSTQQSCVAGQSCEIELLATNIGDISDDISVNIVEKGSWTAYLCRIDGVCASDVLVLPAMGPNGTGFIKLRLEIPADATGQTAIYRFRSSSGNSSGLIMSGELLIEVSVTNG